MDKRQEPSIWKKEIAFRRKPKAVEAAAAPVKAEKPSIWKKEIAFRRKPKKGSGYVVLPKEQSAKPESESAVESLRSRPHLSDPVPPVLLPASPPVRTPVVPTDSAPPLTPPTYSSAAPPHLHAETGSDREDPVEAVEVDYSAADQTPDDAVLPSVTPPVGLTAGVPITPPVTPPAHSPAVSQLPVVDLEPEVEEQAAAEAPAVPGREPEAEPEEPLPAAAVLESTPDPEPALSRRERRDVRKSAAHQAKEQQTRAAKIAKEERKALPAARGRVVGLKVGASQIAAAEVMNKGTLRIVRMARAPLAHGVVVGGELREPEELAAALKTFFRKNKLSKTCVRLGVANNRIGVRTFEIAGIDDEKQLANAVRFRAQETLPIPLEEAVLDYRVLDDRLDEEGVRVRRVLLVVAHRELVERYVAACRKAGLKLIGIDLEAFGLLRALVQPGGVADDAAFVCVTIGHDRSTLAVSDGRICEFTRVLAWGGSVLDVALARLLDITPSAAEPIRRALSLEEDGEEAGLDTSQAAEARSAIATELQGFAREIVASLRFYQEQPNSLGISEILVTGGTAASVGLAEELERLIGLPVRVADPLARVKAPRKLRKGFNGSAGSFAVAVGLGIED